MPAFAGEGMLIQCEMWKCTTREADKAAAAEAAAHLGTEAPREICALYMQRELPVNEFAAGRFSATKKRSQIEAPQISPLKLPRGKPSIPAVINPEPAAQSPLGIEPLPSPWLSARHVSGHDYSPQAHPDSCPRAYGTASGPSRLGIGTPFPNGSAPSSAGPMPAAPVAWD